MPIAPSRPHNLAAKPLKIKPKRGRIGLPTPSFATRASDGACSFPEQRLAGSARVPFERMRGGETAAVIAEGPRAKIAKRVRAKVGAAKGGSKPRRVVESWKLGVGKLITLLDNFVAFSTM